MSRNNFRHLPEEYAALPRWFLEALDDYLTVGYLGSHFMEKLLQNDLQGTVANADDFTITWMPLAVRLVYNRIPSHAWGSVEKVKAYQVQRATKEKP